jgi:hypothetical protein
LLIIGQIWLIGGISALNLVGGSSALNPSSWGVILGTACGPMITHIMNQSDYKELYKQRCLTRLNSMVPSHACMFSNSQNEYGTTFVVEKWSMYGLSTICLSNKYGWIAVIAAMRNHSCFFLPGFKLRNFNLLCPKMTKHSRSVTRLTRLQIPVVGYS